MMGDTPRIGDSAVIISVYADRPDAEILDRPFRPVPRGDRGTVAPDSLCAAPGRGRHGRRPGRPAAEHRLPSAEAGDRRGEASDAAAEAGTRRPEGEDA